MNVSLTGECTCCTYPETKEMIVKPDGRWLTIIIGSESIRVDAIEFCKLSLLVSQERLDGVMRRL